MSRKYSTPSFIQDSNSKHFKGQNIPNHPSLLWFSMANVNSKYRGGDGDYSRGVCLLIFPKGLDPRSCQTRHTQKGTSLSGVCLCLCGGADISLSMAAAAPDQQLLKTRFRIIMHQRKRKVSVVRGTDSHPGLHTASVSHTLSPKTTPYI